ncbi:MAG: hypothetical protein EA379_08480 [Phycisphaerales bacterium]|nr:MAG: hypothetical protein EA379_08480 [Phycisphaerales bacterium]
MLKVIPALLTAALIIGSMSGCANQRYEQLDAAYRATLSRNQELQQELDALQREIDMLQARIGDSDSAFGSAAETNAQLRADLLRLQERYRQLESRLANLDFTALNPETDAALRELARQHPDLITYDSRRGMLRFASDLTFALGSVEVQPQATQSLQALARVLQGAAATGYDLRIVGHTDNVPIGSATAQRHPTNTHLSAHRAIAVRDVLGSAGISRNRMEVAGWGEHRPAVANRPGRGGTEENRRVEIFLVPSTGSAELESSSGAASPAPSSTRREPEPMK